MYHFGLYKDPKGLKQMRFMPVKKLRKRFGIVIYSCFKVHLQQLKGMRHAQL